MLDKGSAEVAWRASGQLGMVPVDLRFTTTVEMAQLTGRITAHRSGGPPTPTPVYMYRCRGQT
jgi:hypothetical protein